MNEVKKKSIKEKSYITPKRMAHEGFTIFPIFSFHFFGAKVLPTRSSNPDPCCLRKETIYQEPDSFRFAYKTSVFFSINIVELDFLVKNLKHGGSTRGFESLLGLKFSVSSYV